MFGPRMACGGFSAVQDYTHGALPEMVDIMIQEGLATGLLVRHAPNFPYAEAKAT